MNAPARYRIKEVARLTGVAAATLRQWERRYGLPSPDRTASSYRLYGEGDIAHIRRMVALMSEGVAPSEAARLIIASGDSAANDDTPAPAPISSTPTPDIVPKGDRLGALDPYIESRTRILEAVSEYDYDGLTETVRKMMYLGSAVTTFEQVVAPVMREVGLRWHDGRMSVAQEHMASEVLGQLVHQLLPIVQPQDSSVVAVLGCFGEDTHTLPLYGLAFRLAQWNYRSIVLGARTPPSAIASAVANMKPTVIGLSITTMGGGGDAAAMARAYGAAAGDVPWLVGGRGVRAIAPHIRSAGGIIAPTDIERLGQLLARIGTESKASRSG